MPLDWDFAIYVVPLAVIWVLYLTRRRLAEKRSLAVQSEAVQSGLTEPQTLHPEIDPALCLGCGACVRACPEGRILGLVDGKAKLVAPADCIGHGACRQACPRGAISLVFGTKTRGVELPHVGPDFQTNVPGIFIAGELGGMGLIRNAIEQGRQAVEHIGRLPGIGDPRWLDVAIVGGGPAGFSASLAAMERRLRFVTLEQDTFGGTVAHFPKGKLVMTQPATLPIYGKVRFTEIRKEKLLGLWEDVIRRTGLAIRFGERVEGVTPIAGGFEVRTGRERYHARSVLLAIGRRGTPRKLAVPGEEQPKVVYRLSDPAEYRGRHVLVVGGGDSALEAAASIAEERGTTVALSYRGDAFGRAKTRNRERIDAAVRTGRIRLLLKSEVARIDAATVTLVCEGRHIVLPNEAVIVCAGGILPSKFLKDIGIETGMKYGTA